MPGHTLTREQFTIYARKQIRTIDTLLCNHRPSGQGCCQCGRPQPCPHVASLTATRTYYRHRLAVLDQTQVLLTVAPSAGQLRHRRRAAVLALLRRLRRRSRPGRRWAEIAR